MSWQPNNPAFTPFLNATLQLEAMKNPLRFLAGQVGMPLLATTIYAIGVFAGWRHTKSLIGAGVVALLLSPVLALAAPELKYAAFLGLGIGAAAIIYALAKKVV